MEQNQKKIRRLTVIGKWKKFAKLMLGQKEREPVKLTKSIKIWHRMILKANKKGYLNIKSI